MSADAARMSARATTKWQGYFMTSVKVNRKGAARVTSGHPWIFRSDVVDAGEAQPGDAVRVVNEKSRSVGTAHYSASSQIALRMLSVGQIKVDASFYRDRIAAAQRYRDRVVTGTNSYRLVYAEADGLPALIVDRYGDYFTIQTLDQGMERATPDIVASLVEQFTPAGIIARNDAAVRTLEQLPRETKILHGSLPSSIDLEMNGFRFHADLAHGQKTGIFLDQRENYAAVAHYGRGRVLDCFTSTGGFAIHLAGHANQVEAIDSSGPALETARKNAVANGTTNIHFREADAFAYLAGAKARFDTIVLDPPAFAKSRSQVDAALRAYKDINLRAMKLMEPGGVLITCSCSHHVGEAALMQVIAEAALDARRTVRVLERRIQAQDHPVLLTVPETLYLKCLVLYVE
jgi:23S rRNA (cytosine1962-C5)-methyltransferase